MPFLKATLSGSLHQHQATLDSSSTLILPSTTLLPSCKRETCAEAGMPNSVTRQNISVEARGDGAWTPNLVGEPAGCIEQVVACTLEGADDVLEGKLCSKSCVSDSCEQNRPQPSEAVAAQRAAGSSAAAGERAAAIAAAARERAAAIGAAAGERAPGIGAVAGEKAADIEGTASRDREACRGVTSCFAQCCLERFAASEEVESSSENSSSEMSDGEQEKEDRTTRVIRRHVSKILTALSDAPLSASGSRRNSRDLPQGVFPQDLWEPPGEADFRNWQDAPVLLRPSAAAAACQRILSPAPTWDALRQRVQGNTLQGIQVDTPLFRGTVVMLMDGLASTPAVWFQNKKRRTWMAVQGKFKQEFMFDNLVSGQEFERRLENLPADWFVDKVLLQLARKINTSMMVGPLSKPYMMSPVASLAQVINVSPEGSVPDLLVAEEDMRLFDPALVEHNGSPLNANNRRKFFSSPRNRVGKVFDTQHVWTFHVWQQFVDMSKFQLDLGITRYSLTRHLAGQPLQFSIKDSSSGLYLFSFDVWHECLL